jgi:hypothetical protein
MSSNRTDDSARADTEQDSGAADYESWLKKASHLPNAVVPRLPEKGQIIGAKYRIEEELGRGGMGAVFRATHTVSGKPVALKWLLRPTSDERAIERFTREARAAGRIDHPNVVDVYDLGEEGEARYLVMELLHGESLRSRLTRGPLTPSEAVELLAPAMQGVAAAHREGVIHRDLKPDNIFLCRARNGEPRPAKVLDFGISTITSTETNYSALTTEGTLLGTPSYIAPEQLESAAAPDVRTDVYAFGVILYEVLTGRVPFIADNYLGLALAIAKLEPVKPSTLRPEIPVELERLVLQAMSKNPKDRPQTMEAFIDALATYAGGAGVVGHSGEVVSVERRHVSLPKSRRKLGLVLAAVLAAVAIAVPWYMRMQRRAADVTSRSAATADDALRTKTAPATQPAPPGQAAQPQPPSAAEQPSALPAPANPTGASPALADPTGASPAAPDPTGASPALADPTRVPPREVEPRGTASRDEPTPAPRAKAKRARESSPTPAREASRPESSNTAADPETRRPVRAGAIRADEL